MFLTLQIFVKFDNFEQYTFYNILIFYRSSENVMVQLDQEL